MPNLVPPVTTAKLVSCGRIGEEVTTLLYVPKP